MWCCFSWFACHVHNKLAHPPALITARLLQNIQPSPHAPQTACIVLRSPYPNNAAAGAIKWWIGNAAEDGKWATVFARLRLPAEGGKAIKDQGVHAFICRIRNDDGSLCKGVEIRDCGYKVGLNGIDNGAIAFHDVRIPRENLLDKFASVRTPPTAPRSPPALLPPCRAHSAPLPLPRPLASMQADGGATANSQHAASQPNLRAALAGISHTPPHGASARRAPSPQLHRVPPLGHTTVERGFAKLQRHP